MAATRYSRQRELVYQAVCATKRHPTAEMVYAVLKPDHPTLSLGTVYRNLHHLSNEGRLTRMSFPVERFDGDLRPHGHFCCRSCGAVRDVELPYNAELDAAVRETGLCVERHATVFYGLCPDCAQQAAGSSIETEQIV